MFDKPSRTLTFETLLTDPLTRLVMQADGVTVQDLVAVMETARDAVVARERLAVRRAAAPRPASYARAESRASRVPCDC